jgi:hypothetical protein
LLPFLQVCLFVFAAFFQESSGKEVTKPERSAPGSFIRAAKLCTRYHAPTLFGKAAARVPAGVDCKTFGESR